MSDSYHESRRSTPPRDTHSIPPMKTRWWLLLSCLVLSAGWFAGEASLPGEKSGSAEDVLAAPHTTPRRPTSGSEREPSMKRWVEQIGNPETIDLVDLMQKIPANDRGKAVEAWLNSSAGVFDMQERSRLYQLLSAWVQVDAEGALQWSAEVQDPAKREMMMSFTAGALAESDPQRAFEQVIRIGRFESNLQDPAIMLIMQKLSLDALARGGPEELAALWKRFPRSGPGVTERGGIELPFPEGTDFRAVQEAMKDQGDPATKPLLSIGNIMPAWLKQDRQGAMDYLIEKISAKENVRDSWMWVFLSKREEVGLTAADQWAGEMITRLPEGSRGKFLGDNNLLLSEERVKILMQQSDFPEWMGETLQYNTDNGQAGKVTESLRALPEDQRIAYLKNLRGPKAADVAGSVMKEWNLSDRQRAEVLQAIRTK